jgi:hypothetical protein
MTLSAERRFEISQRIMSTLVTEMKKIREVSSGADPRATLKARFDSTGTVESVTLNTLLGFDRSIVTPDEFSDMVNNAFEQL